VTGKVYLVGAGPGDPELLTLRGAEVLAHADVVVYDGLANPVILAHAPPHAETLYAGKKHSSNGAPLTQTAIEALLIERARRGLTVVRLKGGDPFVFGRGGEEAAALVAAGIPFEVVPGVSAATAVAAYAGIPLTHRDLASTVALATGHDTDGGTADLDWPAIARLDTIVLFMAVTTLAEVSARLVAAGRDPRTPAAVIRWGTSSVPPRSSSSVRS
jgi:uroporphyrinogen III methyltransferase / synthase